MSFGRRLGLGAVLGAGVGAVVPAVASAAMISVDRPCYLEANAITVQGTGLRPGDTVDLSATGVFETASVGASGRFAAQVAAPVLPASVPMQRRFTLAASSESVPELVARTQFTVTTLAVGTSPTRVTPTHRVRFTFSGFPPGRAIFGHYLRGGKLRATHRFGIASGPCGTLSTRAREFPSSHPVAGVYHVQFDSRRRYSRHTRPRVGASLIVFKTVLT